MPKAPTYASEFYIIDRTIELVVRLKATGESARIRIEILKDQGGTYSVRSYIEEHVTIQPTYASQPKDALVWVDYDVPWVSQSSTDVALDQALNFLSERCAD
jgi:hypothetical protein